MFLIIVFFYPFDIPVTELKFYVGGYEGDYSYYYSKYFNTSTGLPNNIEIPNTKITATYDEINN